MERQMPQSGSFRLPAYEEIPDVGLYLEQTVKYLNSYLAPLGDAPVTASMVSNYVKLKLLPNPQRKQYGRDHIAWLFFIAVSKSVVSLEHIRLLLGVQRARYPQAEAYEVFRGAMEASVRAAFGLGSMPEPPAGLSEEGALLYSVASVAASKACLNMRFEALSRAARE